MASPSARRWPPKMVTMRASLKVIPLGIAMGIIVQVMIFVTDMNLYDGADGADRGAVGLLRGADGRLRQHRGHILMGAGHSIAVQNFNARTCRSW